MRKMREIRGNERKIYAWQIQGNARDRGNFGGGRRLREGGAKGRASATITNPIVNQICYGRAGQNAKHV